MIYKPLNGLGVLALMLFGFPAFADYGNKDAKSLGGHPVCEASAALVVKCPGESDRHCLLVGDNEIGDRLFLYGFDEKGDGLKLDSRRELKLGTLSEKGDYGISDIEALVKLSSGEIVIYGSHSRNKTCEAKKKRRRSAHGILESARVSKGSRAPVKSKRVKCKRLFGEVGGVLGQQLCTEITRTEDIADKIEENQSAASESACLEHPAFNLEGAVVVPDAEGKDRVWVGLRAPLVGNKAVLLRQVKDLDQFKFDGVAFVELGGRGDFPNYGIRELTLSGDKIWGIGGPPADPPKGQEKPHHTIWSFKAAELKDGATIKGVSVSEKGTLPTSSEGLAIHEGRAFVLIDGDEKKNAEECKVNSTYIVIDDLNN